MKKQVILLLALGMLNLQAGMSKLEALSMIETGNNDRTIGKAGEVSRYQIMPTIWKQYASLRDYTKPEVAKGIADRHLSYLETVFRARAGREATDFDRYVLWNAGETYYAKISFQAQRVHPIIRDRANRFVNLRQMNNQPRMTMIALAAR